VKQFKDINYDFRPESYWEATEPLAAILRNVKGTNRRQMIIDYWKAGKLDELEKPLLSDSLDDDQRTRLGQLHPSFMGGEYLPDYQPNAVEIARIELNSTTSDVISIRAAPDPKGIRYRIEDEYETEFEQPFETSQHPLSLKELIEFITNSRDSRLEGSLALAYNIMNAEDSGREEMRYFTTISSDFYPQLYEHFEHVFDDWVREPEDPTPYPEEMNGG
jgi:hypothetical protein